MPVTQPFQGSYNGLAFGALTDVQVSGIPELLGYNMRTLDIPKARQNGYWAGLDYLDERIFNLALEVIAPSAPFSDVVAAVTAAFQPITDPTLQLPLEYLLPGWVESRIITCRPTKAALPIDLAFNYQDAKFLVEMTANDPLLYSSTLHSVSAGLPSPTAGLTFPVTFPATFGASTGGSMSVTNAGNYTTLPIITIAGPVTNPVVTFTATGAFIKLNITLTGADTLVIDMANRTVTLNGTSSRYNTVVTGSSWWGIPPGTWSIGVASSDASPVAALFTTSWRDAWSWAA